MSVLRVVVVGAGVIGLSTVLHLSERFPCELELTLISDKFSPNTTSDKAGAIISPSSIPDHEKRSIRWIRATLQRFHEIFKSEENAKAEITLQQGYKLLRTPLSSEPWWINDVFGFRHVDLDSVEASCFRISPKCVDIVTFSTYIVDGTSYVNWLLEKIKQKGVVIKHRKLSDFDELSSYDIIINCTGLGSRELLGDKCLYPLRGQAVIVKAPWVKTWVMAETLEDENCTVLPRSRNILLGGTTQEDNWNEIPDPATSSRILQRCQKLIPSLAGAEVVGEWVGLRPQRDSIRLESCKGSSDNMLIHCYGHGRMGVIFSWGCAKDIGDIVQQRLSFST